MATFDVIIRYLLDKQSQAQTEQGTKQLTSDMTDVQKTVAALDRTFEHLEQQIKKATTTKDFEAIQRQLKDVEKQVNETSKAYSTQARILRAEAKSLTSDFEQARLSQLRAINDQIGGFSRSALALGVGITGGIFAFANKYVSDAKTATDVTRQWKAEQLALEQSGQRFGAVLAQEALPLLRQAAQLADAAAGFVEDHPEVVRAALNTGVVLAALGAVGVAVSKGIRIYADLQTLAMGAQQLTAAKLMDLAADKQLAAAQLQAGKSGVSVPTPGGVPAAAGAGGLAAAASTVGLLIAGVIAAKYAVDLTNIVLQKTGIAKSIADAQQKILETSRRPYPGIVTGARDTAGASGLTGGASALSTLSVISQTQQQAIKAYQDYQADDLKLIQDHYRSRQKIISDSLKAEQAENAQYTASVARVTGQRNTALTKAADDLARANEQAAIEFTERQAEIVRDGDQQIEQIRTQSAERLRKLAEDHALREEDLTAERDALGLAKERQRYAKDVAEENKQTSQEVQQRRQEIAQRLADLQQSHEQERAQRLADYQARVAEIRAHAETQLKELASQHAAELQEIRAQRISRIRELDAQFSDERQRRREYFLAQIRDLDASLLGEANLKKQRQAQMLQDLDAFLLAERTKRQAALTGAGSSSGTIRTRSSGGYATYGQWLLGDNPGGGPGDPEWVIRGSDTRMIERMLGGMITPEKLMGRLMVGGSQVNSHAVTYNDSRRLDGRITGADRERLQNDVMETLHQALRS